MGITVSVSTVQIIVFQICILMQRVIIRCYYTAAGKGRLKVSSSKGFMILKNKLQIL